MDLFHSQVPFVVLADTASVPASPDSPYGGPACSTSPALLRASWQPSSFKVVVPRTPSISDQIKWNYFEMSAALLLLSVQVHSSSGTECLPEILLDLWMRWCGCQLVCIFIFNRFGFWFFNNKNWTAVRQICSFPSKTVTFISNPSKKDKI